MDATKTNTKQTDKGSVLDELGPKIERRCFLLTTPQCKTTCFTDAKESVEKELSAMMPNGEYY